VGLERTKVCKLQEGNFFEHWTLAFIFVTNLSFMGKRFKHLYLVSCTNVSWGYVIASEWTSIVIEVLVIEIASKSDRWWHVQMCKELWQINGEDWTDIEDDSSQSIVLEVAKVMTEMREWEGASFLIKLENGNPNHRKDPYGTFISKPRAIRWRHVFVFFYCFFCELSEAKGRYSTDFQKMIMFFKLRGSRPPWKVGIWLKFASKKNIGLQLI
jgi:hypothetical protein